jgi:hypothetical protein
VAGEIWYCSQFPPIKADGRLTKFCRLAGTYWMKKQLSGPSVCQCLWQMMRGRTLPQSLSMVRTKKTNSYRPDLRYTAITLSTIPRPWTGGNSFNPRKRGFDASGEQRRNLCSSWHRNVIRDLPRIDSFSAIMILSACRNCRRTIFLQLHGSGSKMRFSPFVACMSLWTFGVTQ